MAELKLLRETYPTLAALIAQLKLNDALGVEWQATHDGKGAYHLDTFVVDTGAKARTTC